MNNRQGKLNAIKTAIQGGKVKKPVAFIELIETSNGIYIDAKGNKFNDSEKAELIKSTQANYDLVFEEIRIY